MKTLKVGDKVKVTGNESNSSFKLHGRICTICEVGEHYYGLEEEIPLKIDFGGVHHHEVELVSEYNETFNPEAHSSLIIDFDKHELLLTEAIESKKVETIEEASERLSKTIDIEESCEDVQFSYQTAFELGAKSDAARNYWYQKFNEEQEEQDKQEKS